MSTLIQSIDFWDQEQMLREIQGYEKSLVQGWLSCTEGSSLGFWASVPLVFCPFFILKVTEQVDRIVEPLIKGIGNLFLSAAGINPPVSVLSNPESPITTRVGKAFQQLFVSFLSTAMVFGEVSIALIEPTIAGPVIAFCILADTLVALDILQEEITKENNATSSLPSSAL